MSFPKFSVVILAAACAAGCDIPTSLPTWTTEWQLVAVDQTVTVPELLPAGVRHDGGGFAIDSFGVASSVRLGEVCELCTCFDGPIPGLELSPHDWQVRLPSGVIEAQLVRGKARIVLFNEVGFDPLDDGQGGKGYLDVVLTDRFTGEVFDRRSLTGRFPPGQSVSVDFDLAGRHVYSGLVARVSGHTAGSGGCPVKLSEQTGFRARVDVLGVTASTVDVFLSDAKLGLAPKTIDLPSWVAKRLRPGDARVALDVDLQSRLPTAAQIDLSVAPNEERLFTQDASLETPLMLPFPSAGSVDAHGQYVLSLDGVPEATSLHFAARTKITGTRIVRFNGSESLRYRMTMRAELPSQ